MSMETIAKTDTDETLKTQRDKTISIIVDLIEDKQYPAYRGISDYIIILLQDLGIERDIIQDIDETFSKNYERYD